MTGKVKFNDNDGTATHFLVTDFDGLRPTMHKVTKSSDKYVSIIMKYVNPDVTFKSGQKVKTKAGKKTKTGFYTFWSAVKIGVEMIVEEEIKNANLLTEGIIDVIKRTFKKALSWIRDFFGKIYKFISKSFKRVFDFMDIEPVVSADGIAPSTISWPN